MARTRSKPRDALEERHVIELIEDLLVLGVVIKVFWGWLTSAV